MTSEIREQASLSRRLENLERENRRLKVVGSATLLSVAGVLFLGAVAASPKSLEAERIVVRDAQGKARMVLAVGDEGPALTFMDQNGKLRAHLGVTKEGPALDLLDATEHPRAELMLADDHGPTLNFYDAKGAQVSLKP